MRPRSTSFSWATLTVCGLLVLAGCSTSTRHWWLTVFFEGVDTPAPVTSGPKPAPLNTNLLAGTSAAVAPINYVHQPYFDRRCAECHVTSFSQQLRASGEELCTGCHKPYMQKLNEAKFVHRPVEKGQCLRCHDPHQSPEKGLLLRHGDALCLKCHDKEDMAEVKAHENIGAATCLSCHDPHRGDQKSLLRKL